MAQQGINIGSAPNDSTGDALRVAFEKVGLNFDELYARAALLPGSGIPAAGLGVNGDVYIDTAVPRIYGPKAAGAWGAGVSLVGAAGINGTNGVDGAAGQSAYALAVALGFVGDEAAWLISLEGADGAAGTTGPTGPAGATGATGPAGAAGADGISAYQVAVNGGFVGTEAAWLASLQGATGPAGATGATGPAGATGSTGPAGATGATGPAGATGSTGPAGPGVPTGGVAGSALRKTSGTDYATAWVTGVFTDPGTTGGSVITNVISLTQAQYDAIGTKVATTLYLING